MADPIIKISGAILQADAVILDEQAEHVVLTMRIPKETVRKNLGLLWCLFDMVNDTDTVPTA